MSSPMISSRDLARRVLVAADVADYSSRDMHGQREAERVLPEAVHLAAADAGLDPSAWIEQWSGDGVLAVLPDGVHEPTVLAGMLPRLASHLREHNRTRIPAAQVRLRVAVHFGLVYLPDVDFAGPGSAPTGSAMPAVVGFPGNAVVAVKRLADAQPPRRVLRQRPDLNVVAVVLASTFEFVRERFDGLRPDRFRPVRIRNKEFTAAAWVHAPEGDLTSLADLDDPPEFAVAITAPVGAATAVNPVNQGPAHVEVRGTSQGVAGQSDRSVHLLVCPVAPAGNGWYLQRRPAHVGPDGEWSARVQLGDEASPACDGDTARLVAVVTSNRPNIHGRGLDEVSPGRALDDPGDLAPGYARSPVTQIVLAR